MGAFNIVRAELACPDCGGAVNASVQFKYGDTRQHEYVVGDRLRWGGNDVGKEGSGHVVVDASAEGVCGRSGELVEFDAYVHIEEGCIRQVYVADGAYDFVKERETYIVLRE